MQNGADIVTPGGTATQKTKLTLGAVGDGTTVAMDNAISTLTATSFGAGAITAPSIGTIRIKGAFAADVTVSGAGVDPIKGKALMALRVGGAVTGSNIMIAGNVGTVTAGLFVDSRLFAGYTGPDDGSGTFNPQPATVSTFKVTGTSNGFQRSFAIASNFNTVTLASADPANGGTKFGFVAHGMVRSLTVKDPKFRFDATHSGFGDFAVKIV